MLSVCGVVWGELDCLEVVYYGTLVVTLLPLEITQIHVNIGCRQLIFFLNGGQSLRKMGLRFLKIISL